jgi:hypothetical protein
MRVLVSAALAVVGAAASGVEPPVISLDLDEIFASNVTKVLFGASAPCDSRVAGSCAQPENALVQAGDGKWCRQDGDMCVKDRHGRICNVLTSTNATCPLPTASAYDHHDEANVAVTRSTVLYIDSRPHQRPRQVFQSVLDVDYAQRGEFIVYFDAQDRSGNQAEQLPFSMLMSDFVPPKVTTPFDQESWMAHITISACDPRNTSDAESVATRQAWIAPQCTASNCFGYDDYDGKMDYNLGVSITVIPPSDCDEVTRTFNATQTIEINTFCLGVHQFEYRVSDMADIFGQDGNDNIGVKTANVTVADVCVPQIVCDTGGSEWVIGGGNFNDADGFLNEFNLSQHSASNKFDYCADLCHQQKWERINACLPAEDACEFFEMDPATHMCRLFHVGAAGHFDETVIGETYSQGQLKDTCHPSYSNFRQCHEPYVDPGAVCVDSRDSILPNGAVSRTALVPVTAMDNDLMSQFRSEGPDIGVFHVNYTCTDQAGNVKVAIRRVQVVDKHQPMLDMKGNVQVTLPFANPNNSVLVHELMNQYEFAPCHDKCEGNLTDHVTVKFYNGDCDGDYQCPDGSGGWKTCTGVGTEDVPESLNKNLTGAEAHCISAGGTYDCDGDWSIKYTCTDSHHNTISKCRNVRIPHQYVPVLNLLDGDYQEFQANHSNPGEYVDAGATCVDMVDGDITDAVIDHGDTVDLSVGGVYTIYYDCTNSKNISARQATRTVVITKHVCPICSLNGSSATAVVEASFPYDDAGASCMDENASPLELRDNVDVVNVETTGTYFITFRAFDGTHWNDDERCSGGNKDRLLRTVVVVDTLKPQLVLTYNGDTIATSLVTDRSQTDIDHLNPARTFNGVYSGVHSEHIGRRLVQMGQPRVGKPAFGAAAAAFGVVGTMLLALARRVPRVVVADSPL